ncbi:hypothetical protein [Actinoplanes sp. HUAS TT8]|uniref:hypothetical protein n=1 Tax=Actinoplanes sp. HUAS TT8 TaxID=3447453 RepID=UPI003F525CA3
MGDLDWDVLDERARGGDIAAVRDMLCAAGEPERLAFGRQVKARLTALRPEDWWRGEFDPTGAFGLAVLGSAPSAAAAVSLLRRPDMRDKWGRIPIPYAMEVIRSRKLPWLGDLGLRLGAHVRGTDPWEQGWPLVAALCVEGGTTPPAPRGVISGWIAHLQWPGLNTRVTVPFVDRLRSDPYLDLLLPVVFEAETLGVDLAAAEWDPRTRSHVGPPAFPAAVAELARSGRLDRSRLLTATVDRLARGGGPTALRPFALLHDALAPTAGEMAGHADPYARMLADAPAAVAGLAQRALRAVDDAGLLDVDVLLPAAREVLLRPVKSLVKTQLTWLGRAAAREPSRAAEIMETVAVAFSHPAGEIQDRALTLIAQHVPTLDEPARARLAAVAAALDDDLAARAATLFKPADPATRPEASTAHSGPAYPTTGPEGDGGALASGAAAPSAVLPLPTAAEPSSGPVSIGAVALSAGSSPLVAAAVPSLVVPGQADAMPLPVASTAELAEEIGALGHEETAVRWERVLAGLVAVRSGADRSPLRHLVARWADPAHRIWSHAPHFLHFDPLVRRVADPGAELPPLPSDPVASGAPDRLLALRVVEIYTRLTAGGPRPPMLVATPTRVDGSLDAEVLADRLRQAAAEGWEPWPIDLEQAFLRLPRGTDPAVAAGLTSAAGRQLAAWLIAGGLPDPVSTRVEQYYGEPGRAARVKVNLAPPDLATDHLGVSGQWLTFTRFPDARWDQGRWIPCPELLTAALPHHREINAAWALSLIAGSAIDDSRGDTSVLPLLAESGGPFGPAMSLALAYALTARDRSDRVSATDAFLILAARSTPAADAFPVLAARSTPAADVDPGPAGLVADGVAGESFAAAVGRDLAGLTVDRLVKLARAAEPLGDAHQAGASRAVWELLVAALPALFPHRPRGLPDLIELATRVAAGIGVGDEIPGLAGLAAARGSSRLLTEARRLHAVLIG